MPTSLVATTTAYGSAPADIVRCVACGHMQVAELPALGELARATRRSPRAPTSTRRRGQRATAARALERIERHVPVGALCDLGCWVGFLLAEAERRGWRGPGDRALRLRRGIRPRRAGAGRGGPDRGDGGPARRGFDAVVMGGRDRAPARPRRGAAQGPRAAPARRRALPGASRRGQLSGPQARPALVVGAAHARAVLHPHQPRPPARRVTASPSSGWPPRPRPSRSATTSTGFEGYSPALASGLVAGARGVGVADRIVWPDFRDRMAVVARRRA